LSAGVAVAPAAEQLGAPAGWYTPVPGRAWIARRLRDLAERGHTHLLAPAKPDERGAFEVDGAFHSVRSLMVYEAMIALAEAAILPELREPGIAVVEAAAGWGALSERLRDLAPDARFLIVGDSERLEAAEGAIADASRLSFAPTSAVRELDGPVALVAGAMTLNDQDPALARSLFEDGHAAGARYAYALEPAGAGVPALLDRWFWPRRIPVLGESFSDPPLTRPRPPRRRYSAVGEKVPPGRGARNAPAHHVGWRRLETR
jgi:hypothetical protein